MASTTDLLQGQLEKAVEEGKIPQGVVFAATGDGTSLVFGCWGSRGIGHDSTLLTCARTIEQALSSTAMLLARRLSRTVQPISKTMLCFCWLRKRSC
jgi:hypothetical protein